MSDVLTLRLEKGLAERLEDLAARRGISKSELARQGIVEYLERRLCQLMAKYEQMSFADACMVRMAEIHRDAIVWTLDREDFAVYRVRRREPIRVIAPEPK